MYISSRSLINVVGLILSVLFVLILVTAGIILALQPSDPAAAPPEAFTPNPQQMQMPIATETPFRTDFVPVLTPVGVSGHTLGDPITILRAGPGLDSAVLTDVPPNTPLYIIGQWEGYDWYRVQWSDSPSGYAWIYAKLVMVDGDPSQIPLITP